MASQPERPRCPVCGASFKSVDRLTQHVNSHFEAGEVADEASTPWAVEALPACGQQAAGVELESRQPAYGTGGGAASLTPDTVTVIEIDMEDTPGAASESAAGPGFDGSCVLCPQGCGQWVPLVELDSHEAAHKTL
ncbi:hypothetical protein V8C86DRAFT_3089981 [Haematococcus lacustris]